MQQCSRRQAPRTLLGFDVGRMRIGVAVGQELTATARPLTTLATQGQQPDWGSITRLIDEWQPDLLIVGVPHHADGSPNAVTQIARRFCRQLEGRYRLPVETIDERLSSREARGYIAQLSELERRQRQNKAAIDRVAAALILESWLNLRGAPATCMTSTD